MNIAKVQFVPSYLFLCNINNIPLCTFVSFPVPLVIYFSLYPFPLPYPKNSNMTLGLESTKPLKQISKAPCEANREETRIEKNYGVKEKSDSTNWSPVANYWRLACLVRIRILPKKSQSYNVQLHTLQCTYT